MGRIPQNHPLYFPIQVRYDQYFSDGAGELLNEVANGMDARKNLFQILKDASTTINPETGNCLVSVYNTSLTRKFTQQEVIGDRVNTQPGLFQKIPIVMATMIVIINKINIIYHLPKIMIFIYH